MSNIFYYDETNVNKNISYEAKKCNFCEKIKQGVKLQTLDLKKYVPICDECYSKIIFPYNFENKDKQVQKNKNK